ncbi:MAG: hypothetical protein H6Q06_2844 [Acidobacteria bacterium]|nr:hypothetical protein [Acidobacteriota bacterium]
MIREIPARSLVVLLALSLAVPSGLPAQQATQAKSGKAAFTPQQLDELTAPVALYPDALLAQMLTCSQSYFQVKELSEWLKKNSQLKGSAVQDAAQKEGFDASYIALSTFPDVVHMMAEKADWTKKLGQAFSADQDGVFDSVQRLRAQAQQQGNLKTTQQQEVVTQKTQSGTQVIVIQPANPQVVYVPQYNPTVVYTQPAPPPQPSTSSVVGAALIGFTAGVIIGAAADDHYWGPHGWHGGYMYHDAWHDYAHYREDAREDWYEHRENMSGNRQENYDQRQQAANQSARQTSASQGRTSSYGSRGYGAQSTQTSQQRSGTRSSALSGYGSGSAERSASARGNRSMQSSRGSRGGRSR